MNAGILAAGSRLSRGHLGAGFRKLAGARAVFAQPIRRGSREGTVLVEGRAEVACVDAASSRGRHWPKAILERLNG